MNMFEELKAWADRWGVKYEEKPASEMFPEAEIIFESGSYYWPSFIYHPEHKTYRWYGGEA